MYYHAQLAYSRQLLCVVEDFDPKVGQTDLVLTCDQVLSVGLWLCMQDYKSVCAAVTICAALLNIQNTDTHTPA